MSKTFEYFFTIINAYIGGILIKIRTLGEMVNFQNVNLPQKVNHSLLIILCLGWPFLLASK